MIRAIETEIFKNLFVSISEEMGIVLMKTAFSPNIKERRDYSTAIFDHSGEPIAQGDHMPVHLGAMPISVKIAIEKVQMSDGDTVILNDPFQGGTHLPDLTMITPVYHRSKQPLFYVANRAHHSDIGGMSAGSMPLANEIFQEGLIIPPLKLVKKEKIDTEIFSLILSNVRTPDERAGDLKAQMAANMVGKRSIIALIEKYGMEQIRFYSNELQNYTEKMMRHYLERIPDGTYSAEDYMDEDGSGSQPVPIRVAIRISGTEAEVDFSDSAPQVRGNINANHAITFAATVYVFRSIISEDILYNAGIYRPLKIITRSGTVVDANKPAAVAGGNVETSQRIVDVVLRALHPVLEQTIPAASQGTMNNVSFGGSVSGKAFAYYETLAGGMGASARHNGLSGVHSHMTNSLNTPIEVLENELPITITRYQIRSQSGGEGKNRGGDGIVRGYRFQSDTKVSVLSERRKIAPYGLAGGMDGATGENLIIKKNGEKISLGGKFTIEIEAGDELIIKTPGGGGYGRNQS